LLSSRTTSCRNNFFFKSSTAVPNIHNDHKLLKRLISPN
jgi:hypothetical protein